MAPKKSTKASAAKTDDSQSDPTSQDASQDAGISVGQMAKTFSDRAKQRTVERRQERMAAIKTAHNQRAAKVHADVQNSFERHDRQLRSLRRTNVERLVVLMRQKRELEAKVDRCQVELARSFEEAVQQLQASIDGRVEDLST